MVSARQGSCLLTGVVGTMSRPGVGCREGVGRLGARRQLLTDLGLQHLQPLGQLRQFAAVETTCGREEAEAEARGPRFPFESLSAWGQEGGTGQTSDDPNP